MAVYYGLDIGGTKIELAAFNEKLEKMLEYSDRIEATADKIKDRTSMFYLGRGLDYVIAVKGH